MLTYAYLVSDFSLRVVAGNSTTLQPLIYKISAVWSNHEGSMLLWMLVLALNSGAYRRSSGRGGERLTSGTLGVMGLLSAAFLLFILFTSSPFLRVDPMMFEGVGLNPLLQDPGAAMHPPMLYLGFVGLSAAFAYAAAALIVGDPAQSDELGARRAALHADGLDHADRRHRAGQLVGLLHAGLGRILVLGRGGECLADALAGGDGPAAQRHRYRTARRLPHLDAAPGDCRLLACR